MITTLFLLLVGLVACTKVLYLHLNNLHPARMPESLWPRVYEEITLPILEELPLITTEDNHRVIEWIDCLFPAVVLEGKTGLLPRGSEGCFVAGQLVRTGASLGTDEGKKAISAKIEGFVLFSRLEPHGMHSKETAVIARFNPAMPSYNVWKVMSYFDKYGMPRPVPARLIPERALYHPNYSPQPPFDSSDSLVYITGMINQFILCLSHGYHQTIERLNAQFSASGLAFQTWLPEALWGLLIPGTQVFSVPESDMPGDKPPILGRVIHVERYPNEKAVVINTLRLRGSPRFFHLVAVIPKRVLAPLREGRQLLELFYSQKLWDLGVDRSVPEVEALIEKVMCGFKLGSEPTKKQIAVMQSSLAEVPRYVMSETLGAVLREGCRHASTISNRFESETVKKAIDKQYLHAYYGWMAPDGSA